jgi:diguanylate cyclase (GGDEF)-like protein/PAS domain S-box-containing protein
LFQLRRSVKPGRFGADGPLVVIPRLPRALVAAVVAACALYVLETIWPFAGDGVHDWVRDWGVELLYLLAAIGCGMRAVRSAHERTAWTLMTLAIVCYGAATLLFVVVEPSFAPLSLHVGWLAFYVLAYVGIVLLLRARLRPFHLGFWLDGVVGVLVLAALCSAFLLPDVLDSTGSSRSDVILGVAYPTADVVLLAMVVWALSLTGRRAGRMWLVLAAAFALFAAGDIVLAAQLANGTFVRGSLVSVTYPLAALLLAYAAYQPGLAPRSLRMDSLLVLIAPALYAVVALLLLLSEHAIALPDAARVLALAALAAALARGLVTVRELGRLHESRRFERGFRDAAIGMALVSLDLRYLKVNDALCRLLDRTPQELTGMPIDAVTYPDDQIRTEELAAGYAARAEKRLVRPDGTIIDAAVSTVFVSDDEEPYYFSQIEDVGERRRSERRTRATLELSRRAMTITDPPALMREAADLLEEVLGSTRVFVSRESQAEGELYILVRGHHSPGAVPARIPDGSVTAYALAQGSWAVTDDIDADERFVLPDPLRVAGLTQALAVPVPRRGGDRYAITAFRQTSEPPFSPADISFVEGIAHTLATAIDRADMEAATRHQALHDPLTGLANRAFLSAHLEHALSAAARDATTVAALLLDLDRFKVVNDALGHTAGDDLLCEVAGRLRHIVRDADVAARLGGDEFVVCCERIHEPHDIAVLAQRIVDAFAVPFRAGGRAWHLGASIGVALSAPGSSAGDLLRDADLAMYRAKDKGGGRYEVFDEDLRERVVERLSLEAALRQAVDRDQLVLHYQPIVDLATGSLESFEALVRWQHPQRGLLAPGEFITIAEDTDLILPIGAWVLHNVCAQLAAWNAAYPQRAPLHVRANLSPRQITPALPGAVATAVATAQIAPSQLGLEITERLLIEEPAASRILEEVRALGVSVALDDFGTGYSSLGLLKDYPVDVLKLDRSLIAGLGARPEATPIVKAAVDMAAALALTVVAEGIERPEQARVLADLGCTLGQGFAFSPPVPLRDASRLVAEGAQATSSL